VEGANGIGRPLAQRLIAAGERVLDVPAKLAARARVFDAGQGRKTDATDTHSIVMVALRDKGLREVSNNPELTVLRLLCDRRDELSRARAQALNRMHRLQRPWPVRDHASAVSQRLEDTPYDPQARPGGAPAGQLPAHRGLEPGRSEPAHPGQVPRAAVQRHRQRGAPGR
jgi:Transposase